MTAFEEKKKTKNSEKSNDNINASGQLQTTMKTWDCISFIIW